MDRQLELSKINSGVRKIFESQTYELCIKVDRAFAFLMGIQWIAAILVAWLVSPRAWVGEWLQVQESLLLAFVAGGIFAVPAAFCAWTLPGERPTRYITATAQMFFSILFIHLSGGRIETHFHIFVSLALLAFYQDIGVLWAAGALILLDHIVRGMVFPLSIYGDFEGAHWRWLEHGGWIFFENLILTLGIRGVSEVFWEVAKSKYDLLEAKEEAIRISKLKSEFVCNMSHEIRTPLSSIIGFADVLTETDLNEDQRLYAETIHRCSESLLVLINDILDFSKIENGLMQIDRHRFDVYELHRDLQRMFAGKCCAKGLGFEVHVEGEIPQMMMGDSHRIRQVLVNLIGNAIKFTEQGKISVRLLRDENAPSAYRWQVQDTGIGIAVENHQKLFRSFSQEHPAISRKYGGSGLGLMISKNLVELMGGRISLESKPGEGSTFSFTLHLEAL